MAKCDLINMRNYDIVCGNCGKNFGNFKGKPIPENMGNDCEAPPIAPTIAQKASSFIQASLKFMATGMHRVKDDIRDQRMTICESCEFCDKTNNKHPSCTKCGCFLNIKISWASEGCPIDKWPPVATPRRGRGCGGCGRR